MSMMYCELHDKHIDTDFDAGHFDDHGICLTCNQPQDRQANVSICDNCQIKENYYG